MTPESTLRDEMRKGNAATSMLDNEAFTDACAQIEAEQTKIAIFDGDESKREVARVMVLGLHEIRRKLNRIVQSGQTASKMLEHRRL